ncbi:type VI secretion system baseplate subunit TssG [Snodgrassella sp. ESL0253]|uniref:type VI secretion system baseplate subunit TssG n=1 Tax=Snodgrassella sp. ESL0253 TaxID=2705031 RepID=UPI001581FA62|nr:type VI secretion system baseplate subunit TssG [Snodgrassella sp. ESL0253]NUE67150.1 type VI secretion system baseplate subunit TssG [Snodgrassella sp. ESL0253]
MNPGLFNRLLLAPEAYNFFQFCHLLELHQVNLRVPDLQSESELTLQFCAWPYLGFPASELKQALPESVYDYKLPVVFTTFMGLIGTDGVMPNWLIAESAEKKDGMENLTAFLDIFHHRLMAMFYQIWKRFHYEFQYRENASDRFSQALLTLIHGRDNLDIDPRYYLGVIKELNKKNKNVFGLKEIVHYVIPAASEVVIEEFIPVKYPVTQLSLGTGIAFENAVLGRFLYDANSRIRISVKLNNYTILNLLYENQPVRLILKTLVKKYVGCTLDVELVAKLNADLLPLAKLNATTPQQLSAGVTVGQPGPGMQFSVFLGEL